MSDFPLTKTEIVASGTLNGIEWVSARAPMYDAVNGYARLPDGHPWLEVEHGYDIENGIPWGEITYQRGNWIGFDSLHAGQYWPSEDRYNRMYDTDTLMTAEMVIEWTKQLAQEAHDFISNGTYSI